MLGGGFRSAFAEANGTEPSVTWPSGIQAPGMDSDGDPGCLDYIWLRGPAPATARRAPPRRARDRELRPPGVRCPWLARGHPDPAARRDARAGPGPARPARGPRDQAAGRGRAPAPGRRAP